jgi:hypothetical protein
LLPRTAVEPLGVPLLAGQQCELMGFDGSKAVGMNGSRQPRRPTPSCSGPFGSQPEALAIPQAHFFGYSMGGWIGFGMAQYAPERVNALLIGGAPPYADRSWNAFRHVES